MDEKQHNSNNSGPQGTATHSGWNYFYVLFSKYRDECIRLGQIVFGTSPETSLKYMSNYHSALYSMAQQVFNFYDSKLEEEITKDWFDLGDKIKEVVYFASDKDFKNQMIMEGKDMIPKDLKTKLLMFFNRIDRLAAEAGLLVGKEGVGSKEPRKGLVGFRS